LQSCDPFHATLFIRLHNCCAMISCRNEFDGWEKNGEYRLSSGPDSPLSGDCSEKQKVSWQLFNFRHSTVSR
jgi:hypothetical protein